MLDRQMAFKRKKELDRQQELEDKLSSHREKEDKTMAMLRDLAAKKGFL